MYVYVYYVIRPIINHSACARWPPPHCTACRALWPRPYSLVNVEFNLAGCVLHASHGMYVRTCPVLGHREGVVWLTSIVAVSEPKKTDQSYRRTQQSSSQRKLTSPIVRRSSQRAKEDGPVLSSDAAVSEPKKTDQSYRRTQQSDYSPKSGHQNHRGLCVGCTVTVYCLHTVFCGGVCVYMCRNVCVCVCVKI